MTPSPKSPKPLFKRGRAVRVDARKAVRLLGWQPRHGGFADGAATYFAAWRAHIR